MLVDIDGRRSLRSYNVGEEEDDERKTCPIVICKKSSGYHSSQESKHSTGDVLSPVENNYRELTMENGQIKKEEKEKTMEEYEEQVEQLSEEIHTLVPKENNVVGLGHESQMCEPIENKNNHIQELNQKIIDLESNQQYSMKLDNFREELHSVFTYKDELEVTNKKLTDQLKVLRDQIKLEGFLKSSDKFHINQLAKQLEDYSGVAEALRQKLDAENLLHEEQKEEMEREYGREVQARNKEIQE